MNYKVVNLLINSPTLGRGLVSRARYYITGCIADATKKPNHRVMNSSSELLSQRASCMHFTVESSCMRLMPTCDPCFMTDQHRELLMDVFIFSTSASGKMYCKMASVLHTD